jgi:hypothetical protein
VKKLNVPAESWPGSTCRLLLDNYDTILKIASKDHGSGDMNEVVYADALTVALGVSAFLEGYLEGWGKTHRFDSNAVPFTVHVCVLSHM